MLQTEVRGIAAKVFHQESCIAGLRLFFTEVCEDPGTVVPGLGKMVASELMPPLQSYFSMEAFFLAVVSGCIALHLVFQFSHTLVLRMVSLVIWLILAGCYATAIYCYHGNDYGIMRLTGYFLEFINMVENLFIFHSRRGPEDATGACA